MRSHMIKILVLITCAVALTLAAIAQEKPAKKKASGASGLDKAYLQRIWDGWDTLDTSNQAQFYAKGPHMFFDVAPLKYNSWDEYAAGVGKEFVDYKGAKFTVNDDAEIHSSGDSAWVASTVKADMERKSGKHEMSTMRWTAVFHRQEGKWLIVHEHVSEPVP